MAILSQPYRECCPYTVILYAHSSAAVGSPSVPTALRPVCRYTLSEKACCIAGLTSGGSIFLSTESGYIHNVAYNTTSAEYSGVWKKSLPSGVKYDCYKAANDTEIALQDYDNDDTHHFSHALKPPRISRHKGRLLDLSDDGDAMYERKFHDYHCVIDVDRGTDEQPLFTLQPSAGRTWGSGLSVCKHPAGFVVVDYYSKTLTTYSLAGRNKLHSVFIDTFMCYIICSLCFANATKM